MKEKNESYRLEIQEKRQRSERRKKKEKKTSSREIQLALIYAAYLYRQFMQVAREIKCCNQAASKRRLDRAFLADLSIWHLFSEIFGDDHLR